MAYLIKLKESDIKEETHVCPYCMDEIGEKIGCCGEAGHDELAYITSDGDCYLESEVELIK